MAAQSAARSCLQASGRLHSSAAVSFLQLAPRRGLNTSTSPFLDFLAPRLQISNVYRPWVLERSNNVNGRSALRVRRYFSTTERRRETRAILHAAKDDDGNDMSLEITARAAKRLKEIMAKDANPNLALRIQVESGGCHGFQYLLSLSTLPPLSASSITSPAPNNSPADPNAPMSASNPSPKEQEVVELDDEDVVFEETESKAKVVIDVPSLELLKGSQVEFTTGLIGSQFTVVNPNSSSNCGCGTSFDIKI